MRRSLLLGLGVGLLLAGCSATTTSGETSTTPTGSVASATPIATPTATPTSGPGQFVASSFGESQVATLVMTNTPSTEFDGESVAVNVTSTVTPALSRDVVRRTARPTRLTVPARPATRHFQQLNQGDTTVFYISNTNQNVTCQKVLAESQTVHCTIFAEVVNGSPVLSQDDALRIATAWDSNNPYRPGSGIYDQVRAVFGSEWTSNPAGGADGDAKINLLMLSSNTIGGAGTLGYFSADDEFPTAQLPDSNQGEILYLNASYVDSDFFDFLATTAHEFQHCVNWNEKVGQNGLFAGQDEDDSIDEGKSVLAEDLCGFGLTAQGGGSVTLYDEVSAYLANTNTSFFEFDQRPEDYGKSYMLMRYLYDRFGASAFTAMATAPSSGLANLNASFGTPFSSIFQDWAVANLVSPLSGSVPSKYVYSSAFDPAGTYNVNGLGSVTLPGITPTFTQSPPEASLTPQVDDWVATYVRYGAGSGGALVVDYSSGLNANLVLQLPGSFQSIQ